MKKITFFLIVISAIILSYPGTSAMGSAVILQENFEGSTIDNRITVETVGGPSWGIRETNVFGSTKAFGFGRSSCEASCWDDYATKFIINFSEPTFVTQLSFKEMELYANWGSGGKILIDGEPLILEGRQVYETFGKLPYNNYGNWSTIADVAYRSQMVPINQVVSSRLELQSWDITYLSEIFMDDLAVTVPVVVIAFPYPYLILQDQVSLRASTTDLDGKSSIHFYMEDLSNLPGTLSATFNNSSGFWEYALNTTLLPDGNYYIRVKAADA